jgi:hypothetical protein
VILCRFASSSRRFKESCSLLLLEPEDEGIAILSSGVETHTKFDKKFYVSGSEACVPKDTNHPH